MKIYLSKSNTSEYEVYTLVKDFIIKQGHTLIEHNGGCYNPEKIKEADYLIIIPPAEALPKLKYTHLDISHTKLDYYFTLGKGQTTELLNFHDLNENQLEALNKRIETRGIKNNVLFVNDIKLSSDKSVSIEVDTIDFIGHLGNNWQHSYSELNRKGDVNFLDHILDFELTETKLEKIDVPYDCNEIENNSIHLAASLFYF